MAYADRVKETTTTTGTGTFVLSGVAPVGFQTFASSSALANASVTYCAALGAEWEVGDGVYNSGTLSRNPSASSNGGELVNFSVGVKDIFCTLSASQISKLPVSQDISFSQTVPLSQIGTSYMPPKTVTGALTFTPAASAVRGSLVYLRLIANGVNAPLFTGFSEWGGSLGYDNRNGIVNQVQFFYDGNDAFYSISQAVGAVASANAITMTGPTSGVVSVASSNFTLALAPTGGSGSAAVTPSDGGAGGTFTPTSSTLATGVSRTFTYTPSAATGTRSINITNNAGLTNPAPISYVVSASATAPATMAAPTATAGDTSATVTMVAPATGGSAITGYTVTSNPAGGVDSNAGATGLTHTINNLANGTAYTFTSTATNAIGTSPASPASNSVTPVAGTASIPLQFTASPTYITEYVNTPTAGAFTYQTNNSGAGSYFSGQSPVSNKSIASGADGALYFTNSGLADAANNLVGFTTSETKPAGSAFSTFTAVLQTCTVGLAYSTKLGGAANEVSAILAEANDLCVIRRIGGVITAWIARAATPTTWIQINGNLVTGSTGVLWGVAAFQALGRKMIDPRTTGTWA